MTTVRFYADDQQMGSRKPIRRVRVCFSDKEVLKAIQRLQLERGVNAHLTAVEIAQRADVCRNTVYSSVSRLERAGYLEYSPGGGHLGNHYRVFTEAVLGDEDDLAYA